MKKKHNLSITYSEYNSLNSLPKEDQILLYKAIDVAKGAYAKYSNFKVGSAIQLANGEQVVGSNQENAAYPSGLCAERVAIFSASARYPNEQVNTIAIYAAQELDSDNPVSPCGACRQVLMEYELKQEKPIRLLLLSAMGKVWEFEGVKELLPFAFKFKPLKK